jgi:hypothetical protein
MAMASIAKSNNIAVAILLKESIGIANAITFATSIVIAIAIDFSRIANNPGRPWQRTTAIASQLHSMLKRELGCMLK